MIARILITAILAASPLLLLSGCACPYGACRTSGGNDAGGREDAGTTVVRQNLTDVEIEVEGVDPAPDSGYILRGTIVKASPAGGAASIAETGQSISLRPYYPAGTPDLSDAGHRRMVDLAATSKGARVRCRIALDARGTWRIVSAK